jgi:hypothetical protein
MGRVCCVYTLLIINGTDMENKEKRKEAWKKNYTEREILKTEWTRKRRLVSSLKFGVLQSKYPTYSLVQFSATRGSIFTSGHPGVRNSMLKSLVLYFMEYS